MTTALSSLSDSRLLSRLDTLAARERRITGCILDHLMEVERRDLYLKEGFSSMFSYCTARLHYSASAANRRIRTMRAMRRFPRVRDLLETGRANLSTVSMVASHLDSGNHDVILSQIAGRSQREVEEIIASLLPARRVRDSVKPVRMIADTPVTSAPTLNSTPACEYDRSGGTADAGADSAEPTAPAAGGQGGLAIGGSEIPATHAPDTQFIVRFAAGSDVVRKIEAARALLSFRLPAGASMEQIFGAVLDEFIERHDPVRRAARRTARIKKKATSDAAAEAEATTRPQFQNDTDPVGERPATGAKPFGAGTRQRQ